MSSESEIELLRERAHYSEVAVHLALYSAKPFWNLRFGKSLDDAAILEMRQAVTTDPACLTRSRVENFAKEHLGAAALSWFENNFISTVRPLRERQNHVLQVFIQPAVDPGYRPNLGADRQLSAYYSEVLSTTTLERLGSLNVFLIEHSKDTEAVSADSPIVAATDGYLSRLHPAKRLVESDYAALLSAVYERRDPVASDFFAVTESI